MAHDHHNHAGLKKKNKKKNDYFLKTKQKTKTKQNKKHINFFNNNNNQTVAHSNFSSASGRDLAPLKSSSNLQIAPILIQMKFRHHLAVAFYLVVIQICLSPAQETANTTQV